MAQRKSKKSIKKFPNNNHKYDYEEDFLYIKEEDDNDVKLNFKTKKQIKDEFLESLENIPKEHKKEKAKNPSRFELKNKKKNNFLIENNDKKDLDKQ